jgi:outer membrane protein OmpA-like peptidoglycan-associated protein
VKKEISEKAMHAAKEVLFAYRSDKLATGSTGALDAIVAIMKEDPDLHLSIDGHTDNVGNETYNLQLSQRRADAVAVYISAKGISAERLTATGYGREKPIADNRTEKGRAENRRVELSFHY